MSSVSLPFPSKMVLGPEAAGIALLPSEFDEAEFEPGWRYELIHGVLGLQPL